MSGDIIEEVWDRDDDWFNQQVAGIYRGVG
jgi:hypothetical protein